MKTPIIAAAVFAASLAGSTAVALGRGGDPASGEIVSHLEDSAAADTTSEAPAAAIGNSLLDLGDGNMSELAALVAVAVIDTPLTPPPETPPPSQDQDATLAEDLYPSEPVVDPAEEARIAAEERRAENARQLARIFSSMQAAEAAEVMSHMRNAEVVDVLGYLGSRKAGQVMAEFSSTRAATISRLLLEAEGR